MSEQWTHIGDFLIYLGVTVPLLLFGLFVFMVTTPYNEYRMIREGSDVNDPLKQAIAKAAAHDLGGKIIGLALVLASAVYHSVGITDLIVWGVIGAIFQVVVFYLFELATPFSVVKEIRGGNVAVALFASRLSIATGLLMAALISY